MHSIAESKFVTRDFYTTFEPILIIVGFFYLNHAIFYF